MTFLLGGCYSDKGNYDYSDLQDVTLAMPSTGFDVAVGDNLKITPTITTSIPDNDLTYQWEIYSYNANSTTQKSFHKLADGKDLDYTCIVSDEMPGLGDYKIRLHAIQKSTNRDFYSNILTVSMSGITGLMVLHGDGTKCDIGFLKATDFLLSEGTITTDNKVKWYSTNNNGATIPGVGKKIIQSAMKFQISNNTTNYADVVVITDKGGTVCNFTSLSKKGDWGCMFLIDGSYPNKPMDYFTYNGAYSSYAFCIDGNELFLRGAYSDYILFRAPNITTNLAHIGAFIPESSNAFFFDSQKRAFYGIPYLSYSMSDASLQGSWGRMFAANTTNGNFNMASMNADLLDLESGGQANHYMAVMKNDDGSKYLADINHAASSTRQWDYAKYDMSALPDIANAKFYTFGESAINMCYYATPSAVYNFAVNYGSALSAQKLTDESGKVLDFGGAEITMLKVLKQDMGDRTYYNRNQILLVGTYGGSAGTGKLYSLKINPVTGLVLSQTVFTGYDRIYDANMKGL